MKIFVPEDTVKQIAELTKEGERLHDLLEKEYDADRKNELLVDIEFISNQINKAMETYGHESEI